VVHASEGRLVKANLVAGLALTLALLLLLLWHWHGQPLLLLRWLRLLLLCERQQLLLLLGVLLQELLPYIQHVLHCSMTAGRHHSNRRPPALCMFWCNLAQALACSKNNIHGALSPIHHLLVCDADTGYPLNK
jgi:hypothetical protein